MVKSNENQVVALKYNKRYFFGSWCAMCNGFNSNMKAQVLEGKQSPLVYPLNDEGKKGIEVITQVLKS